ncbi:M3 family peptidase [Thiospirochaeta perfilievii]|uniref:M3 family peptidase n=1 Tax=Thiospirochaeta perfilievii TaxID=252967 RepID=A0A5C1QGI3_9SPIO|nr:M3 family metallopeptidase [Thiospirochaeta perfilievii]QEN06189.1 M3 family peptidase [Thiospirochaeta perfilievii]
MKNPIIDKYDTKYGSIPFSKIEMNDYLPALEIGLINAYNNIKKIKSNVEPPNFTNTIEALEFVSEDLDKVANVYFNLYSLDSDADFKKLAEKISPKLAKFSGDIFTDTQLFDRVNKIYNDRENLSLSAEEKRLLDITYNSFRRNGALLKDDEKIELQKIDEKLSLLGPQFSKNTLDGTNSFELHITDPIRVKGLPESSLEAASFTAKNKGYEQGWVFTLQMPSYLPVMQYAEDRELRKELSLAYGTKNLGGEYDNRDIIKETIDLKFKRARLLGYNTHAHYTLEKRMANTPEIVDNFLNEIYETAYPAAKNELEEVKALAKEMDNIEDFNSWDFAYYSQKLKLKKYNFDPEVLRPYLKAENVINGVFDVANKMYGLNFIEVNNVELYHKDVTTYEVRDNNDSYIGLLYVDLYPRETKRSGAWMNTFKVQGLSNGEIERPHVLICGNLSPSTESKPSLLSFDETRTIFHEFGHALHGLLSNVRYKSLASPNVYWDFVELPSQIMENWLLEPETLSLFAKHYNTGEVLPTDLIEKVVKSQTFNAGNMNIRQLSLGFLDMAWHTTDPKDIGSVEEFEDKINEKTRLLPKTEGNTSTGFGHIFAGGYSSGYYSYKWAEVLDADAFEYFKEMGIFNKEVANSFRSNILSKGNTVDPMELYKKFRGTLPNSKALLKRDGLI